MERQDSVMSFTSDQLDDADLEYDSAPWDVSTQHQLLGIVVVAKEGDQLPFTTKYKTVAGCDTLVSFRVERDLIVTVAKERPKPQLIRKPPNEQNNSFTEAEQNLIVIPRENPLNDENSTVMFEVIPEDLEAGVSQDQVGTNTTETANSTDFVLESSPSRRFRGTAEFLTEIEEHFEDIVISGLESGYRASVKEKIKAKDNLNEKEDMAIVHAVNQAVFNEFGRKRPEPRLCQQLGEILKRKFPETYGTQDAVRTDFGTLVLPKTKGS